VKVTVRLWKMGARGHSILIGEYERVRDAKPALTPEMLQGCVYLQVSKDGKFRYPWWSISGKVHLWQGDLRRMLRGILRS